MAAGALVVAVIDNPWIALPLALVVHFGLDMLPHYGDVRENEHRMLAEQHIAIPIDVVLALLVLGAIIVWYPESPWLVALGGVICASPDLTQVPRYIRFLRTGDSTIPNNWFIRFHLAIQRYERRWGIFVELPILLLMLYLLFANA